MRSWPKAKLACTLLVRGEGPIEGYLGNYQNVQGS